jgi:hypothetical protein
MSHLKNHQGSQRLPLMTKKKGGGDEAMDYVHSLLARLSFSEPLINTPHYLQRRGYYKAENKIVIVQY